MSLRSFATASLLTLSQLRLTISASAAGSPISCSANLPQSCHNTSAVEDTCCFASPGGLLLQTQFWDTPPSVTGPVDSWTVHGLWPDNCDGTYQANCDPSRAYTNITQILLSNGDNDLLNFMQTYWTDYQGNNENFWDHEWAKHGTCISTFDTDCYNNYTPQEEVADFFNSTTTLYSSLPSYKFLSNAGIVPSSTTNYTSQAVLAALNAATGFTPYISCDNGALNEIWYYFYLTGSVQTGTFGGTNAPGKNNNCPASIQYLPKSTSSSSSSTSTTTSIASTTTTTTFKSTTTSSTASPTSGAGAFVGKGNMDVYTSGSQNGCLISGGTWYTSGTCATFTGTPASGGVTLKSGKGNCAIVSGALSCGSSVSSPAVFGVSGTMLEYNSSADFYASAVPSGSTQAKVEVAADSVVLQIEWQGI